MKLRSCDRSYDVTGRSHGRYNGTVTMVIKCLCVGGGGHWGVWGDIGVCGRTLGCGGTLGYVGDIGVCGRTLGYGGDIGGCGGDIGVCGGTLGCVGWRGTLEVCACGGDIGCVCGDIGVCGGRGHWRCVWGEGILEVCVGGGGYWRCV